MKSKKNKALTITLICLLSFGNASAYYTLSKNNNSGSLFQRKKKANATTIQCKAKAKSTRRRCRNMTSNASGYCSTHGG